MEETFTAVIAGEGHDITIISTRGSNSGPIFTIPLPTDGKFGMTWINNAIEAKGFRVESAWSFQVVTNGLWMEAILSEI